MVIYDIQYQEMDGSEIENFDKRMKLHLIFGRLNELIRKQDRGGAVQYMIDNYITPKTLDDVDEYYLDREFDPLETAACEGDLDMVKILLDTGFSIKGIESSTLISACTHDKPEIVEFLAKEHHVNLETTDCHGKGPPVKAAIEGKSFQVLKCLLDLGVSPNQCYDVSAYFEFDEFVTGSALHHAVLSNSLEACRLLIEGKADVNINPERYGSPPLFVAICGMKYEISHLLLEAGADVNLRNTEGATPFLAAVKKISDPVLNTVQRIKAGCHVLDTLLSYGADPEAKDDSGMTPLHYAVFHCSTTMLQYLVLQVGVSLKNTGLSDETLFSLAIKLKRWSNYDIFDYGDRCCEVIEFLVASGYDLYEEPSIFDDQIPLMALPKGCVLIAKLRELAFTPQSLRDMCIFKIRETLGRSVFVSVSALPLPNSVIKMIGLEHLHQ